jgi:hypothetical protein
VGSIRRLIQRALHVCGARRPVGHDRVAVPALVGMAWPAAETMVARSRLLAAGPDPAGPPLAVLAGPAGVVVDQLPPAGAVVASGSTVIVWTERGPGSAAVSGPRVIEKADDAAS